MESRAGDRSNIDDVLELLANEVIPPDDHPGGWAGGVARYLDGGARPDSVARVHELGEVIAAEADRRGVRRGSSGFGERMRLVREVLAGLDAADARLKTLVALCMEGYYGGSTSAPPAGWRMLGYEPWPLGAQPKAELDQRLTSVRELKQKYDIVVIGSGVGGVAAAYAVSQTGASVLLLERARALPDAALAGDHIRGKRMAVWNPTAGAGAGFRRFVEERDSTIWSADGDDAGEAWGLNAMCLGGGTRLWQGMAWRMTPRDFRMASTYGVPKGSSLVDWPISYEDLKPFYEEAERLLGVSGSVRTSARWIADHPGYPMPALPADDTRRVLGAAADRLGWTWGPIPMAINSATFGGRPKCAMCHQCIGHACPVDARNGVHNTLLPAALASESCHAMTGVTAVRIKHAAGSAQSVELIVDSGSEIVRREVEFGAIVIAAGAVETPRLILASGLGNDQVGRNLHAHSVYRLLGRYPESLPTFRGPGHSIATMDFLHGEGGTVGGGIIFDLLAPYPLQLARWATGFANAPYGQDHKTWIREMMGHVLGVMTMGHEVPSPRSRVTLERNATDRYGCPCVRLSRDRHPETDRTAHFLSEKCSTWLAEAGVVEKYDVSAPPSEFRRLSPAGEHAAGTVRMGEDPRASAAAPDGLVWGTRNVFVTDAALLPTSGGTNPALTILANALRVSRLLARRL